MKRGSQLLALIFCFAVVGVAEASWYDDYELGIKAVRAGQWAKVVEHMTKAIRANGKEDNKARMYGAIFINYKPYYYRGIANLNLGRYQDAISDLETTKGPGEVDLGPIETNLQRAKAALETPTPTPVPVPQPPVPQPPVPQPPTPQPPSIDPVLRQRADAAIKQARERLQAAQQRNATTSPDYANVQRQFGEVNLRFANADTNNDLRSIIAVAENVALMADSLIAPPPMPQPGVGGGKSPEVAENLILSESRRRLKVALTNYFDGEFEKAAQGFQQLSKDMPTNPWVWAFLGASQWSLYAFETEEQYKQDAIRSFKRAKQLGSFKGGLPQKYFSRRIRNAFSTTAG